MTHDTDFYSLLHVQPDAPTAVVKASYRAMMQKMRHHPDLGGDAEKAQLLNEAVDTLCNPSKRSLYDRDRLRQSHAPNHKEQEANSSPDTSDQGTDNDSQDAKSNQTGRKADGNGSENAESSSGGSSHQKRNNKGDSRQDSRDQRSAGGFNSDAGNSESDQQGEKTANTDEQTYSKLPAKPQCPFCHAPYPTVDPAHDAYDNQAICIRCGGATTAIRALDVNSSDDLRRIYRHQHQAVVALWPSWPKGEPLNAFLSDLSLAGCAIDCDIALPFDQVILLKTDAINAICQVCYCQKSNTSTQHSVGLQFLTLRIMATPGTVFSATA